MKDNLTIDQKILIEAKRRKWGDRIFIIAVLFIPILHWLFFTGYVNITMFYRSFTKAKLNGDLIFTFDNYVTIFKVLTGQKNTGYWSLRTLWNSLSILPLVVVISQPFTFLISYYIYKKYPGFKLFRVVMMLCTIVSAVVFCQFWKLLMNNQIGIVNELLRRIGLGHIIPFEGWLGNKNTAWGNIYLFSLWTGLGGSTMLYFSSAMTRMPESLFESADLDGATEMKKLTSIVVPLIWPVYCTMCITSLGIVFGWYLPSFLMTGGGPESSTSTIGIIIINEAKELTNIGLVSAMGVYIFILGGTFITLAKHFMTKLYEEVEY